MLYKLTKTDNKFTNIEPVPFDDFAGHKNLEEDLENLIANNLLGVLFEENRLMPIFQERKRQEEADIYALNENGDLIIFELKRDSAKSSAVHQALRYCEKSGGWGYSKLQNLYDKYRDRNKEPREELSTAHGVNFDLDSSLGQKEFNNKQHLMIVGSASNNGLIKTIDYWKKQGLSIDFVPYRVYEIGEEFYFEFFSIPYDKHTNPKDLKGVLFDTNKSYDEESLGYMLNNSRVAAFGGVKHVVNYLNEKDTVFLYHKGVGIVAAGVVSSPVKKDGSETLYRDIKLLTKLPPENNEGKYSLSASEIKKVLGKNFFWARTIKTPYLSPKDVKALLKALESKQK